MEVEGPQPHAGFRVPEPGSVEPAQPALGQDRSRAGDDRPRYDPPRPRYDRPRPGYDRPRHDAWSSRTPAAGGEAPQLAEGEELVAGRRPVEEAFVARREARRLLVVPQRRMALEKIVLHATSLRIPVIEVEGGSLTAIAGFDGHQGVALVVAPRQWAGLDDILAQAAQRHEAPLVLALDSLEDPQNLGTLLRSAEASGVHGAIFPTRRQAPLSPAAVKASAGAVEHLRLAPVDDLPGALADLHARGLRIIGADGDAPLTAREADLRGPVAIVVGSEGRGLGPAVRRRCDLLVRIPMHGRIQSLNAAVAGSILLYEAAAQRGLPDEAPAPRLEPDATKPASPVEAAPEAGPVPAEPDAPPDATDPGSDAPPAAASRSAARAPRARAPRARKPASGGARGRSVPAADAPVAGDDLLPGGPLADAPDPAVASATIGGDQPSSASAGDPPEV